MGCWGAAEGACQNSARGRDSTETLSQRWDVETLGTVCVLTIDNCVMAGGCFSGLRVSTCHPGDLGKKKIFFVLPKFHFLAKCGEISLSGPLCAGLEVQYQRGMVGCPVEGGGLGKSVGGDF